jgi:[FeFe] hydrogenase H-cluster maturation GTPase HydF
MDTTPKSNRVSVAFFGLRNAGKSTLVNAFTGQDIAIVSDTPGTTTDPVSKAMEILPLGPCLITDTAGLDDVGELGEMRVKKTLRVLETADIAVWVDAGETGASAESAKLHQAFLDECTRRSVVVLEYRRGDSVEELKKKIAAVKLGDVVPGLLDGLVEKGDRVVCVCPIDESAPKGRLILPQVQLIRDCLDRHITATVCQPEELAGELSNAVNLKEMRLPAASGTSVRSPITLVVTDSQAFAKVKEILAPLACDTLRLTSFSILFARQKGDLGEFLSGVDAVRGLKDGDTVLVAEGCTHHRQCNDIGTVKIPKAVQKLSGRKLNFVFASGNSFDLPESPAPGRPALVVHCGGCMLTRREVLRRIAVAKAAGVPIVNYGILLAAASGLDVSNVGASGLVKNMI